MLTVVGARPQFIKASTISRRLRNAEFSGVSEAIVHTGQHYDEGMSQSFFRDLEIPEPRWNLNVGSGTHGQQTGAMIEGLERIVAEYHPDLVLVYGDTNSTLAGALTAAKAGVPLAHVEAGLRSFRRGMAEEINRVVTDRLSDTLFCPTAQSVKNLEAESRRAGVHLVGDVMHDAFLHLRARLNPTTLSQFGLQSRGYVLATVHRAESTDDPRRLTALIEGLGRIAESIPVVLPLHPRTKKQFSAFAIAVSPGVRLLDPLPHGELLALAIHAAAIATDSGGLQKEAYFASVPCVTLRDETEWTETLKEGWNRLPALQPNEIATAIFSAIENLPADPPAPVFGDGDAAGKILRVLSSA